MRAETVRLGEFFSGPGGMALGAHLAAADVEIAQHMRLEHAWAYDIDADSCRTYSDSVPGARLGETVKAMDVRQAVDPEESDELFRMGSIDGFAFGFPCNDFSLVGERKGLDGKFGGLYKTGVTVLEQKQPDWFVAENVGGIRSANNGSAFALILGELADAGYDVTPHLYRFEEYGVPQRRHRVIVVGIRSDIADERGIRFRVPKPTHGSAAEVEAMGVKPYVTAADALDKELPFGAPNAERARQTARVIDRISRIKPGMNAFNAGLPDDLKLNVRGATISQIYRRLAPDEPSYTVTGSGGGGTHMYHWAEPRALTNRERARLQTFDDMMRFHGNRDSVRKQIGMAVPVEGAKAIFTALFRTLHGIPYETVPANIAKVERIPLCKDDDLTLAVR